jgi:carboxyl-terminal processing protease
MNLRLTLTTFGCLALAGLAAWCAAEKAPSGRLLLDEVKTLMAENFFDQPRLPAFFARLDAIEKNQNDVRPEIKRLLDELQVSHLGLYTPDDLGYYEYLDVFKFIHADKLKKLFPPDGVVRYPGIGIIPRLMDGRYFVAFVLADTPAAGADILPGDELISVDGLEYSPVKAFKGKAGRTVKLALRREQNGPALEREVAVENLNPGETFINSTAASARIIEHNGRKFGYIRLYAFTDDKIRQILDDKLCGPDFAPAEALILDLRGRLGGAPLDAAEIFIGGTPSVEIITSRVGDVMQINCRWTKPLAAVIGPETRSGMEILAYSLKRAGLPLVGANTQGALLGGAIFILKDNSLLMIPGVDFKLDGQRLEGIGVAPTILVEAPLEYGQGRDPQLEAAVNKAAEIVGGGQKQEVM